MSDAADVFAWPVRVYYEDTDAGGVVQHTQYLKYLERARTEWLRARGIEQDALAAEHGILFVVTRIDVRYRRPARFNERLFATARSLAESGRARLWFEQTVVRAEARSEPLVTAWVEAACVDSGGFRARRLPPFIASRLGL